MVKRRPGYCPGRLLFQASRILVAHLKLLAAAGGNQDKNCMLKVCMFPAEIAAG